MSTKANLAVVDDLAVDRCVARRALLARGLTEDEVDSLRDQGVLADVFRGLYVVGAPRLTQREFLRASLLHSGPGSFATAWTGLELRSVLAPRLARATMTTTRRNVATPVPTKVRVEGRQCGLLDVVESTPTIEVPLETVDGFETTLVPRTLIETAAEHGAAVLRQAWSEAEFLCLLDPNAIHAEVSNGSRRKGTPLVRRRLHDAYPLTRPGMDIRSRSGERLFLSIVREAGLPEPEVNARIRVGGKTYRVDFYWRELRLVVEVDGPNHDIPERAVADKVRDTQLANHGFALRRYSTESLASERAWCIESLVAAHLLQAKQAA